MTLRKESSAWPLRLSSTSQLPTSPPEKGLRSGGGQHSPVNGGGHPYTDQVTHDAVAFRNDYPPQNKTTSKEEKGWVRVCLLLLYTKTRGTSLVVWIYIKWFCFSLKNGGFPSALVVEPSLYVHQCDNNKLTMTFLNKTCSICIIDLFIYIKYKNI